MPGLFNLSKAMEEIEGVIVNGMRYDIRMADDTVGTCGQCAFLKRDLTVCLCCGELTGKNGYFVKSEKQVEP